MIGVAVESMTSVTSLLDRLDETSREQVILALEYVYCHCGRRRTRDAITRLTVSHSDCGHKKRARLSITESQQRHEQEKAAVKRLALLVSET